MSLDTKEIVVIISAAVGLLGGGGTALYETQFREAQVSQEQVQDLQNQITSQKIQICLLINEMNRQNNSPLANCAME